MEAFGETGLRTYDLAVMAQAGAVFLAYVDEEIVGGCQLLRIIDEPDFCDTSADEDMDPTADDSKCVNVCAAASSDPNQGTTGETGVLP